MNWLLIIVLVILLWSIFWGYKKGLIRVIYSMIVGLAMMVLMSALTPMATEAVKKNTKLDDKLVVVYEEQIRQAATESKKENPSENQEIESLDTIGIHIPEFVLDKLDATGEKLEEGISSVVDQSGIYTKLATVLSDYTVMGIVMLVLAMVLTIIFFVIEKMLNLLSKLPIIKQANGITGAAIGCVAGLFWIWVGLGAVALFSGTPFGVACNEQIQASQILMWLFDNNPILHLFVMFM